MQERDTARQRPPPAPAARANTRRGGDGTVPGVSPCLPGARVRTLRRTLQAPPNRARMPLYVVLHHPADRRPSRWSNAWEPGRPDRIASITTTPAIAQAAQDEGHVFVHRCGHGDAPPTIVCEARVLDAAPVDRHTWLVRLETIRSLQATPPTSPSPGQNSYVAEAPDTSARSRAR